MPWSWRKRRTQLRACVVLDSGSSGWNTVRQGQYGAGAKIYPSEDRAPHSPLGVFSPCGFFFLHCIELTTFSSCIYYAYAETDRVEP